MAISKEFTKELEELLNRHSIDSEANIPDFILAETLTEVVQTLTDANNKRERWYGREPKAQVELEAPKSGEQA